MPGGLRSAPVARSNGPGAEIAIASGRTPPITAFDHPAQASRAVPSTGVGIRRTGADRGVATGGRGDLGAADVEERDHWAMMPTLAAMLLAIDVGNTNIVVGVFDGERLVADFRIHTDDRFTGDELGLVARRPARTARPRRRRRSTRRRGQQRGTHARAEHRRTFPHLLQPAADGGRPGHTDRHPHPVRRPSPGGCRPDRQRASPAHHLYQGPAILVDFGTATTFDAIDARGDYLGGAIAPGIQLSHDALVSHAAMLIRVELTAPAEAIGHSTTGSMQSGIVFGYVGLVEGLVGRFRAEMEGQPKVIATGGPRRRRWRS